MICGNVRFWHKADIGGLSLRSSRPSKALVQVDTIRRAEPLGATCGGGSFLVLSLVQRRNGHFLRVHSRASGYGGLEF